MFGIGMPELLLILFVALIVIGPKKLPDMARALGKGMAEFKKATQDIKDSMDVEEEYREAKQDIVDSISGLERPEALEPPPTGEDREHIKTYDQVIEENEKQKSSVQVSEPEESGAGRPQEEPEEKGENG